MDMMQELSIMTKKKLALMGLSEISDVLDEVTIFANGTILQHNNLKRILNQKDNNEEVFEHEEAVPTNKLTKDFSGQRRWC